MTISVQAGTAATRVTECRTPETSIADTRTDTDTDERERQLIQQARVGGLSGERARTQLLGMYYPWIRTRCEHILKNKADADDASQESALRMYEHLPKFEGRSLLRTWVGAIATRACINVMRRNSRTVLRDHIAQMISLHEDQLRALADTSVGEEGDVVQSALHDLLPDSRDVLQLRFYSELSLEEISNVLGISLSATKMRLYRALDQFKAHYGAPA